MKDDTITIEKLLTKALSGNEELDLKVRLDEKLVEYDLSKSKVISILNIDKDIFDDIINGTVKQPSLINIIKIAQFLEVGLEDAIAATLRTQSKENLAAIEKAKKASFVVKNFDTKKLTKIGFFKDSDEDAADRLLSFFGYESVYDFENELSLPLYSKSKRTFSDKMKDFWVKSAYQCFKSIDNPNPYDREQLKELIVNIKPYSQDVEDGLFTVCKALYNIGVTVIFQNQLTTTQVRGGTFLVNGKPCIVLTDLFKRYTTIWVTLIHELYHVLYDLNTISSTNIHLTGDPDLFLIEEKADAFAREYFCGLEQYYFVKQYINNAFIINRYAKEWEVHPSFIYASFQYFEKELNNKNYWGAFAEHFPDYTKAVADLHPITWKESSIREVATELKTIFELNTP